jgi:hypothetical protein
VIVMPLAKFDGLESWAGNYPVVECATPTGIIDLHNNAEISRISIDPREARFSIEFVHSVNWEEINTQGKPILLHFDKLRQLRLTQAADYDPRAAITFEHVIHWTDNNESRFEIDMGDIHCEFLAGVVTLTRE